MKTLNFAIYPLLAAVLVALTSCSITDQARYKETRTLTVDHIPGSAIMVVAENGAISVQASDRTDVEIVARLQMTSPERLEAATVLTERDSSDRLTIKVAWPDGKKKNNEGCSFTIAIPDAKGVDLRTANGRVQMAGLSGNAELHTSNGAIDVKAHEGNVVCRTSNGAITVAGTDGDIDTRTSNGRVDVREARQSVKARSSNGSVRIHLTDAGTGPVDAQSSNGSMTLTLGAAFRGELELRNSNGSLDVSELPDASVLSAGKHHMRLQFGESQNRSRVTTSNGAIRVDGQ